MKVPNINIHFELDNTIKKFISVFKWRLIFLRFPESKQILKDIEEVKFLNNNVIQGNNDFFEIPITTGVGKDFYNLVWNIDAIKNYLVQNPKQIFSIPLNQLHKDDTQLNPNKLTNLMSEFPNYKCPIILVDLTVNNIVIDGNHRCSLNAENNISHIKAIRLNMQETYQFIFSPQHKKLFALHFNLMSIYNFCNSNKEQSFVLILNDKFIIPKKRKFIFF